ncbi:hypothetical protein QBC46DRAFT_397215 [Diplogelasinospora grovesii]|uniref:Uncharacterized protein n=1 Tax=Diplogelasinospora grovesii TaxID=303347 RepID=A0AAN6MZG5_9PEZI|nr:hypothetical protein QBC46DRAFT_397215 [Diplogelasinospora grovesii]
MQQHNIGRDVFISRELDDIADLEILPFTSAPSQAEPIPLLKALHCSSFCCWSGSEPSLPWSLSPGVLDASQNGCTPRILNLVETMSLPVIIAFFGDSEQNKEEQWKDCGIVSRGAQPRNGLGDSDAEEVEVAHTGELEEDLLREEVIDRIARGTDGIGYVCVPSSLIDERLLIMKSQRNSSSILGRRERFCPKDKLNQVLLVPFTGSCLEASCRSSPWPSACGRNSHRPRFLFQYSLLKAAASVASVVHGAPKVKTLIASAVDRSTCFKA